MTDIFFFAFRAFFITLMTIGMMASLTEFRFGRKKLLLILGIYGAWVAGSSSVLLWIGGEFDLQHQGISIHSVSRQAYFWRIGSKKLNYLPHRVR